MWTEGSKSGGTTRDGWGYEHNFAAGVSRAWKDGFPDLEIDGEGHEHAIFRLIDEHEDREPVELRRAS